MKTAFFSHDDCKLHEMGAWHPEAPSRLQAIEDAVRQSAVAAALDWRSGPLATEADLARVHTADAIYRIRENCPSRQSEYAHFPLDADTGLNAHSWQAALRAAGLAMAAVDAVMQGEADNAFCAIRPPGHHASASQSMGFCLFNNVAIAARYAQERYGLKRIVIVDFDVHHGNGTEDIFSGDNSILMTGFFQHPFYPYCGTEFPAENMLNTPVDASTDGEVIRSIVNQSWLPAMQRFKPELVLISAGFDAHCDDEMAQMRLTEEDYAWMTQQILQVAQKHASGRIVSCLEGGYNLNALSKSVIAHLSVLTGLI